VACLREQATVCIDFFLVTVRCGSEDKENQYNVILKKEIEIGIVVVEISVVTNLKKNLEDNSDNNLRYKNKVQDSFYNDGYR
jgi:chemotaxis signal transduction protein